MSELDLVYELEPSAGLGIRPPLQASLIPRRIRLASSGDRQPPAKPGAGGTTRHDDGVCSLRKDIDIAPHKPVDHALNFALSRVPHSDRSPPRTPSRHAPARPRPAPLSSLAGFIDLQRDAGLVKCT